MQVNNYWRWYYTNPVDGDSFSVLARLGGYPRPLLLRLEPVHRPTLGNNIHRDPGLGASAVITESWY
jgi:hypothetical protein